jgi:DNA-binding SARP family transcriptional activator/Tfp pilus assembly protein PilF
LADGWRFRLAGPLEVRHDGKLLPIAAAKQRVLIAVLALATGEPVTVERLIECLWDDQPPLSARNTLQNYVLRLRRILQVGAEPAPLVNSAAGYSLDVHPDAVDVHRFRSLVRFARSESAAGEPESAAALLDEALGLWHGEPLADVPSEVLHRELVPGLAEQHLAALEQRIDLDLDLGRHEERITELVALSAEYPHREPIWAQLMLALYRSGRPAEALDAYRQAAKVLAADLGIDPGPELHDLYQAVLANDPGLMITGSASAPTGAHRPTGAHELAGLNRAHGPTGATGSTSQHSAAPRTVPRQLPPPSAHFVGRAAELRHLDDQLDAASGSQLMVISAIGGTAGIGKTALALHWGHRLADRFPDGQLYVNLRGFDPAGAPLPLDTAMRGFLTALGVPEQEVPAGPEEQTALYRSRLVGRRMLVVLDNARDAEQVRPLLPGAPECLVLVTSRDQLTGLVALDGAVPLTLDLLTDDEARDLLIRRLGPDRVAREQADVNELIDRCARLPLALNIAAAHAALRPNRPLAAFVDELRDTHRRLDALTTGDAVADVRVVFSWSYHTLSPTTARVFRLLGVQPGQDISLLATASLAGCDPDTTRRALDELTRAHLIIEHRPGRYILHDLLRAYAAEQANIQDDETERQVALRRVVDFYTHTACGAELVLTPFRDPIRLDPPAPGAAPHQFGDPASALAWLDAEHAVLLAVQQTALACAWHPIVWQLAWSLATVNERRGHRHDNVAVWQAALDAAAHLPDPLDRMVAHRRLCTALADLGRHDEGIRHGQQALDLAEEHHDLSNQAAAHNMLAWAWVLLLDDRQAVEHALDHATHAVELRRALGQPEREAKALNLMGWCLAHLGDFETGRAHCESALAIQKRVDDPEGEAATLDSLGYIANHSGHHQQAIDYYQQALPLLADLGYVLQTADTLDNLGHPHTALGQHEQARTVWRKALEVYQQQGRDEAADRVQRQLDTLNHEVNN